MSGRRLLLLVAVLAALGAPAALLQVACIGRSCDRGPASPARVPFCGLPEGLRRDIVAGYREGRSPDVLAVTDRTPVFTRVSDGIRASWPGLGSSISDRVPLAFSSGGTPRRAALDPDVTLDRVAPTVAAALGFDRPFPEVRSGTAIDGFAGPKVPRLVLMVAWKGVGSAELEPRPDEWPFLASMIRSGAGTLRARTGSLPLDPTATLTTLGTGGLPSQHGITGSVVRGDGGDVVPAFGDGAPVTVIATLAEDLDKALGQRPVIGLVGTSELDRGVIGGAWYPRHDTDEVVVARGAGVLPAARAMLRGMGDDADPDILAVVLDGSIRSMDRRTDQIVRASRRATGGSLFVAVAGTGSPPTERAAISDEALRDVVEEAVPGPAPAVAATVPGGFYLDQDTLRATEVTGQVAVEALLQAPDDLAMADAFQGFAVSFARFC